MTISEPKIPLEYLFKRFYFTNGNGDMQTNLTMPTLNFIRDM